jgi:hypothetical protein
VLADGDRKTDSTICSMMGVSSVESSFVVCTGSYSKATVRQYRNQSTSERGDLIGSLTSPRGSKKCSSLHFHMAEGVSRRSPTLEK